MAVVGVDGCKGGWFAVRIEGGDEGDYTPCVFPTMAGLLAAWDDAALILIDVPIGLPHSKGLIYNDTHRTPPLTLMFSYAAYGHGHTHR